MVKTNIDENEFSNTSLVKNIDDLLHVKDEKN